MLKQKVIAAALAASTPTFAAEHWIDVRIPEQYQHEHIQGALNIPLSDIQAGTFSPLAKEDTLYLYCNSGRQATLAQEALQQMGYQHGINMGGIAGLNKPVVTSKYTFWWRCIHLATVDICRSAPHLIYSMNKFSDFMAARNDD